MKTSHRSRWGTALSGLSILAALGWWALRAARTPPDLPGPGPALVSGSARAPAAPAVGSATAADGTAVGVRIRPAGSVEADTRGMVPHPITPQHQRIFRENNLIGDLNGAMDVRDAKGLRGLLAQYREEYPEDAHVLQDGYELIASCLESATPETRAAAQRYYDEQLDSGLRRYIRRHCLQAPAP